MYGKQTHAASHFGRRVELDGQKFDSIKEAQFYSRYIKPSGYVYRCQERFTLLETYTLELIRLRQTVYKADFVIYDDAGRIKHVYDVKNSLSRYNIDEKSRLKFKMFARKYGVPVEVVVPRAGGFLVDILGTTKKIEPVLMTGIDYDWQQLIR